MNDKTNSQFITHNSPLIKEGYKKTEIGVIPEDWKSVTIPDVIRKNDGIKIGPFGSQLKKELLVKVGFKVYGQENIYKNDMTIGDRFITKQHFDKLKSCELIKGDFIISMMGTIGKSILVPEKIRKGIMDSHLLRLRLLNNKLFPLYLLHFFSAELLLNQVSKLSVGGIMDGLSSTIIKKIQIPLPPLPEQKAIAEVLSDTDELIQTLQKQIVKKSLIKQGAMQVLLSPPATTQMVNGELSIVNEKEKWEVKKLGEIADIIMGQSPSSSNYNNVGLGLPLIQGNADIKNRKIIIRNFTSQITKVCKNQDIIMTVRAPVGEISISTSVACIGRGVCAIRYKNNYLFHYLIFIEPLWAKHSTGSTFDSVNSETIRNIEISIPKSKTEQTRIATILSDMDSEIEMLGNKLAKYKKIKQGMMQELLTGKTRLL